MLLLRTFNQYGSGLNIQRYATDMQANDVNFGILLHIVISIIAIVRFLFHVITGYLQCGMGVVLNTQQYATNMRINVVNFLIILLILFFQFLVNLQPVSMGVV